MPRKSKKQMKQQKPQQKVQVVYRDRPQRKQKRAKSPSIIGSIARFGAKYLLPVAKTIFGMGDYSVHNITKTNSLFNNGNYSFKKERVIITHREFIGDIISGQIGTFNSQLFSINPGDQTVFPWLANIAQNFESYRFMGLAFEYKTMSVDALNSTNTALGQVIMSVQYDAANQSFTNKQAQEAYDGAISIKPSQSVLFGVECAPAVSVLQNMYIRNDTLPPGTPIQFTDIGVLQVSTNGMQAAVVNVGELWVAYHIELIHEKLNIDTGEDYYRARSNGALTGFSNLDVNGIHIVGYKGVQLGSGTIFLRTANGGLPPGQYQLIINMQGPTGITGANVVGTGIIPINVFNDDSSDTSIALSGAGIWTMVYAFKIVTAGLAALDLTGLTWTGTTTIGDIIIVHAGDP